MRLRTRHDWIADLTSASTAIAAMKLDESIPDGSLETDGFNFANDQKHKAIIIRAVENLLRRPSASPETIKDIVKNLIRRDHYGRFAELSAYDWLLRCNIQISAQIPLTSTEVLGANGATLDGKADYVGFYFDIKAFGFHGNLARRLKERLEKELPGKVILIEESWDLSVEVFEKLISKAPEIARGLELRKSQSFDRLRIRMEDRKPVQMSAITIDPYLLASENAKYAFRFSNQFARNAPFFLIFVAHPWLSQGMFHHDFAGSDTTFTRSLARRTFMQFTNDTNVVNAVCSNAATDVTFADAAKLLSAIIFLNVWPSEAYPTGASESSPAPVWVYLNPRAAHPITRDNARLFAEINPHIAIDDFVNDDY
jgi:hypothetical protein